MYADPRHIKDNRINARFNDIEIHEIEMFAELTSTQKSTLVRNATLKLLAELKTEFKAKANLDKDAV